ncbi:MAG: CYTH domain-containing protein [Minisyncoccota bacterium]
MKTEYEATFLDINREDLTKKLKTLNANLERPEYMQRRVTLELPKEKRDPNTWLRVRDEGDKVTLTLKSVDGKTITGQKEILVEVNNFGETVALVESIGCERKSYQESKRELWRLGSVEVAIDTWPFLATYVELEGPSEEAVRVAADQLGFDYSTAIFDTVNGIYKQKYGKTLDELDRDILKSFTFDIKNPFV